MKLKQQIEDWFICWERENLEGNSTKLQKTDTHHPQQKSLKWVIQKEGIRKEPPGPPFVALFNVQGPPNSFLKWFSRHHPSIFLMQRDPEDSERDMLFIIDPWTIKLIY